MGAGFIRNAHLFKRSSKKDEVIPSEKSLINAPLPWKYLSAKEWNKRTLILAGASIGPRT
jgi:hypothetical protein